MDAPAHPAEPTPPRRGVGRAVGPRLRIVLHVVLGLFAVLGANSLYLSSITFIEWLQRDQGRTYQNYFYQYMFLGHLGLGLLLIVPFILFGVLHIRKSWNRPNRHAIRVGYGLFFAALLLLGTGLALMRLDGFEIKDPRTRSWIYWLHLAAPLACVWLYVLHRLSGPRLQWRIGRRWAVAVAALVAAMFGLHQQDPRRWHIRTPKDGDRYFAPSSARTASGNFIPAASLMNNSYCLECHSDSYAGWEHSAHRFSSFNNPFYLFSVNQTRQAGLARDGTVQSSRWCAGCHDPAPFFSGAFDDPQFDMQRHPTSQAGITCVACHSIVDVRSTQGNGDYVIEEPIHYPWAFAPTNSLLFYLNKQLVKAKPAFHKQTFLKPLHKSAEFCSTCHKVGLPREVTQYKDFLRGQNHYDTFLLTGISGHSARSFYYPPTARENCASCHMPLVRSDNFGARPFGTNSYLSIHDHLFPGANTALPFRRDDAVTVSRQQSFLSNCVRVDLFGVREGGQIDGNLIAPIRPALPRLRPGKTYLIEAVVRNLSVGHPLTQGTADSNEVWVEGEVTDTATGRTIGHSGALGPHREVDPWSHFINIYMLDRYGNRIDRRNAQDIFVPLYNNQIPPSGSSVVHYRLTIPPDQRDPLKVVLKVNYRKFDTIYLNYVQGQGYTNGAPFQETNDLPITVLASDTVTLPVDGGTDLPPNLASQTNGIPTWQRWNDYGIGLFNKGDKGSEKGELREAEAAFAAVEKAGRAEGPLNLSRVYVKEGRLEEAVPALQRAADTNRFAVPAPRWTLAWLSGLVNKQNGHLDQAIQDFTSVLEDRYPELDRRKFDFSKDYEIINELGLTLFERTKRARANPEEQRTWLLKAVRRFQDTLAIDSENVTAHYNLSLLHAQLGDEAAAAKHRQLHERYRVDDNARDRAVAAARLRSAAADHASQSIVIYDLQKPEKLGPVAEVPSRPSARSAGGQP